MTEQERIPKNAPESAHADPGAKPGFEPGEEETEATPDDLARAALERFLMKSIDDLHGELQLLLKCRGLL